MKAPESPPAVQKVVVVSPAELKSLVREAVAEQMGEFIAAGPKPARLHSRQGLAAALGVSTPTVDKLTREGAPHLYIGDSPRFQVSDVVAWLKSR